MGLMRKRMIEACDGAARKKGGFVKEAGAIIM